MRFDGNAILSKIPKLVLLTLRMVFLHTKLDFSDVSRKTFMVCMKQLKNHEASCMAMQAKNLNFAWEAKFGLGDPFYAIFTNKIFGKRQKFTAFKHK